MAARSSVETAVCGHRTYLISYVSGIGRVSEDRPRELCNVCREDDGRGLTRGRQYEFIDSGENHNAATQPPRNVVLQRGETRCFRTPPHRASLSTSLWSARYNHEGGGAGKLQFAQGR